MRTKTTNGRALSRLRRQKSPVLITDHGRPAAYLMDIATYEQMQSRIRLLEGIARGEMAVRQGRVLTHAQAEKKMRRWLK